WSSDVCSSDLRASAAGDQVVHCERGAAASGAERRTNGRISREVEAGRLVAPGLQRIDRHVRVARRDYEAPDRAETVSRDVADDRLDVAAAGAEHRAGADIVLQVEAERLVAFAPQHARGQADVACRADQRV